MRFFIKRSQKAQSRLPSERASGAACLHPVSHQVTLHEDSSEPLKITGVKCDQCGDRLPSPERVG